MAKPLPAVTVFDLYNAVYSIIINHEPVGTDPTIWECVFATLHSSVRTTKSCKKCDFAFRKNATLHYAVRTSKKSQNPVLTLFRCAPSGDPIQMCITLEGDPVLTLFRCTPPR